MTDNNDVDTVTPLDGDGQNVVFPSVGDEGDLADKFDRPAAEDYDSKGQTTVATPFGYAFVSSDQSLPVVTHQGVNVTKEQADAIVAESDENDGKVYVRTDDEGEG